MTLAGFDPEFVDLDDYIRVITARIWEGRRVDTIAQYYGSDCAVITPSGASRGVDGVVRGTLETLAQFPDRRLLCEDIVSAGDASGGWLSSHRIASTMTHSGPGAFGPPSGHRLHVRTVADCVCKDNRIVHEWLVRDQGAMALQIGSTPQALASQWLQQRGAPTLPLWAPAAPAGWTDPLHDTQGAALLRRQYEALWRADLGVLDDTADEALDLRGPSGERALGVAEAQAFWFGLTAAFNGAQFSVESLAERIEPGRTPRVAMRWRLRGTHHGAGRYGAPTGRPVEILGITHAEVAHAPYGQTQPRVLREWLLIDEVALWMQLL